MCRSHFSLKPPHVLSRWFKKQMGHLISPRLPLRENITLPAATWPAVFYRADGKEASMPWAGRKAHGIGWAAGKSSYRPSAKDGSRQTNPARGHACEVNGDETAGVKEKKKLSLPAATKKCHRQSDSFFPAACHSNLDARVRIKKKNLCRRPAAGKGHFFLFIFQKSLVRIEPNKKKRK